MVVAYSVITPVRMLLKNLNASPL